VSSPPPSIQTHSSELVKLFDGSRWEERLAGFSGEFAERKKEFEFALSIHTAQGVDNVQRTLITVEAHAKDGSESAQMIILFRQLESPKERELQKWIAEKGGPKAVSENEKVGPLAQAARTRFSRQSPSYLKSYSPR